MLWFQDIQFLFKNSENVTFRVLLSREILVFPQAWKNLYKKKSVKKREFILVVNEQHEILNSTQPKLQYKQDKNSKLIKVSDQNY